MTSTSTDPTHDCFVRRKHRGTIAVLSRAIEGDDLVYGGRIVRPQRWVILALALLLLLALLVTSACGMNNPIHEPPPLRPTSTPTELPLPQAGPDHSALYYLSSDPLKGTTLGALGVRDGTSLWLGVVPGIADSAVIGGGIVYVGEGSQGRPLPGEIPMEALSESNGALLWQSHFPAAAIAPLAVSDSLVFVQANGVIPPPTPLPLPNTPTPTPTPPPLPNAIIALRAGYSAPLWHRDMPGAIFPWAIADDNALYAVIGNPDPSALLGDDLTAIDARDGHTRWQLPLQSALPAFTAPVESGGVLYFSEQYCACHTLVPSTMLAVRASDGKVLWQKTAPDAVVTEETVVTGGIVSFSYTHANGLGGGFIALHAADGSPAWQVSWSSITPDGFAGSNGALYAAVETPSGRASQLALVAYDARSGAQIFDRPLPRLPVQLDSTPGGGTLREAGGTLYFVSPGMPIQSGSAARLVSMTLALRASDGSLSWARMLDGNVEPSFFVVP